MSAVRDEAKVERLGLLVDEAKATYDALAKLQKRDGCRNYHINFVTEYAFARLTRRQSKYNRASFGRLREIGRNERKNKRSTKGKGAR